MVPLAAVIDVHYYHGTGHLTISTLHSAEVSGNRPGTSSGGDQADGEPAKDELPSTWATPGPN